MRAKLTPLLRLVLSSCEQLVSDLRRAAAVTGPSLTAEVMARYPKTKEEDAPLAQPPSQSAAAIAAAAEAAADAMREPSCADI